MSKYLLLGILLTVLLIICVRPATAAANIYYYPVSDYSSRIQYKDFGTLVDQAFYKGKEPLFPTKFYGYHAAVDLEAKSGEQNSDVPVYAIADGKILFAGQAQGYGGVIIQSIDGENVTALYGHVKLPPISHLGGGITVGDKLTAGQQISSLGKAFSSETGGERKHLHFAIHKGVSTYMAGHEPTQARLSQQWENPTTFLQQHTPRQLNETVTGVAVSPTDQPLTPTITAPHQGWWQKLLAWISSLL